MHKKYFDEIVCPFCGHEDEDNDDIFDEAESGEHLYLTCTECDEKYEVKPEVHIQFLIRKGHNNYYQDLEENKGD